MWWNQRLKHTQLYKLCIIQSRLFGFCICILFNLFMLCLSSERRLSVLSWPSWKAFQTGCTTFFSTKRTIKPNFGAVSSYGNDFFHLYITVRWYGSDHSDSFSLQHSVAPVLLTSAQSYESDLPAQCMNRRTAAGRKRRQSSKERKRREREREMGWGKILWGQQLWFHPATDDDWQPCQKLRSQMMQSQVHL